MVVDRAAQLRDVPDRVDRGRRVQHLLHRERHVAVRRRSPARRRRGAIDSAAAGRTGTAAHRRVLVDGGDRRRQLPRVAPGTAGPAARRAKASRLRVRRY